MSFLLTLDRIFEILWLMVTSLLFFIPFLFVHTFFLTLKWFLPSLIHKFANMRVLVKSLCCRNKRIMMDLLHFFLDDSWRLDGELIELRHPAYFQEFIVAKRAIYHVISYLDILCITILSTCVNIVLASFEFCDFFRKIKDYWLLVLLFFPIFRYWRDLQTIFSIDRNAYELAFVQKFIVNLIQMVVDKVAALSINHLNKIQCDVILLVIVFEGLVGFGGIGVFYSVGPEIYRHLNK